MTGVKNYADHELLQVIREGRHLDPVLQFMYAQYYDLLKIHISQNGGNEADAEDIFQEVLVSFIEIVKAGKFRGDSSIKTFLFSLNRNIWLNELKKRGRAQVRELKYEKARDTEEADTATLIAGRESRKQVMDLVERLGEGCRKILVAFYYEDKNMKEILETTDFENEQVVRNKKYKCLKQLEQILNADPNLAKTLKTALQYGI